MIRRVNSLVASVLAGLLTTVFIGAPAQAHSDSAPAATDYRSRITNIAPRPSNVEIRLVAGGSRMELINSGPDDVIVYGYDDEPYLRISENAVYANTASRSAYVNEDLRDDANKASTDATTPPTWHKIRAGNTARWHDHRTHWMDDNPPSIADHDKTQRLSNWQVRVQVGGTDTVVHGTLDYLAPPRSAVWWAALITIAGLIALIGAWRRTTAAMWVLASVLAIAAFAELADSVARVLDDGERGLSVVGAIFATETYGTLTALAALAAAAWAVFRGRAAAAFALALAATCLGVLGGLTDIAVFNHGRATAAWTGDAARIATTATLAGAVGVALAGWWLVRRDTAGVTTPHAADSSGNAST